MKETIRNIELGNGLGVLKFGMLSNEVSTILKKPNEIEVYYYSANGNERSECWHYEEYELSVNFNEEDEWMLDTISINSNYYLLFDKIQIGQSRNKVESTLEELEITNLELEDLSNQESPDHKLITVDKLSLNLWFDIGILSEIQWGPKFKDDENIIWPYEPDVNEEIVNFKNHNPNTLMVKLDMHLNEWLNKIFRHKNEYTSVIDDFPAGTERENLSTENKSIRYYLDIENKPNKSIEAKAWLHHNEEGLIGWMSVIWDCNLKVIDDFLVIE